MRPRLPGSPTPGSRGRAFRRVGRAFRRVGRAFRRVGRPSATWAGPSGSHCSLSGRAERYPAAALSTLLDALRGALPGAWLGTIPRLRPSAPDDASQAIDLPRTLAALTA